MSGLAKQSSFDVQRYDENLDATLIAATTDLAALYDVFVVSYRAAGQALAQSRAAGGAGTVKGALALDQASEILNDDAVTQAAEGVATYLANGC